MRRPSRDTLRVKVVLVVDVHLPGGTRRPATHQAGAVRARLSTLDAGRPRHATCTAMRLATGEDRAQYAPKSEPHR
jgi:hypothetical protein